MCRVVAEHMPVVVDLNLLDNHALLVSEQVIRGCSPRVELATRVSVQRRRYHAIGADYGRIPGDVEFVEKRHTRLSPKQRRASAAQGTTIVRRSALNVLKARESLNGIVC
jgi:hypothetical protein